MGELFHHTQSPVRCIWDNLLESVSTLPDVVLTATSTEDEGLAAVTTVWEGLLTSGSLGEGISSGYT